MKAFLSQHLFWVGIGSLWAFSALVGGMPAPDEKSGKAYQWVYSSLHLLAANLNNVAPKKPAGAN
jgi:hypothetical protein